MAWRLTPAIKREFVLCLRPVALSAMFNKDMESVTPAVGALKKMAVLEPDLIMPQIMERAIPSLQGLEETFRTPAVTYALAALSQPLVGRQIWRIGGMYAADIFALLLPGIDLNDPAKTGLTCMAISNMVDFIHIGDISECEDSESITPGHRALRKTPRERVKDDERDPTSMELDDLTPEEVNYRVKAATEAFRDWVPDFIGRVLLLFSNLPEEGGKSGKAEKTEQLTLMSVLHTCGGIFAALDDKLFDVALNQIYEYTTTTCQSSAVDAVGELIRNLTSANAAKTLAKFFPVCKSRIELELKNGASSTRTTTTSIPVASDADLHWWLAILYGMLVPGRVLLAQSEYRKSYIELLRFMAENTFSERGWAWTGKIFEKSVSCLTSIYYTEMKMLNRSEQESEDHKTNHTLYWGRMYRPGEVKPEWRIPTADDIDMVFEIFGIAENAVTKLNALIDQRGFSDKIWSNDFCRAMNIVDKVLRGSYNLIEEHAEMKTGGVVAESHLPKEITDLPRAFKSGVLLSDPSDPRYQTICTFRKNVGEMLHRAADVMKESGDSDASVEPVRLVVTTIGTLLTAYGMRSRQFEKAQSAYSNVQSIKKLYESQRKQHRSIFIAAASVHHQNRLANLSHYRTRSELDDKLIINMVDFCLSPFVRVRVAAQKTLHSICVLYRGTWVLFFQTLLDALRPGTDPDRMKGALYVLRYNPVGISRIVRDWSSLVQLVVTLLNCYHENKTSIQNLVAKAMESVIAGISQPSSFDLAVRTEGSNLAADAVVDLIRCKPDPNVIQAIRKGITDKIAIQDQQWEIFVEKVLAVATNPQMNWKYALAAERFLSKIQRRDRPTDLRLAKFFMEKTSDAIPRIRDYGFTGISTAMFHITLRASCGGSDELLFLQEPLHPLLTTIDLPDRSPDFTAKFLASFKEPLPADETKAALVDRSETGWLAWGKTMEVVRLTGWEEDVREADDGCKPAVELIASIISQDGWWPKVAERWGQEEERTFPSATHIDFVLSTSHLIGLPVFYALKPIIEESLSVMETTKVHDRHKMRALWELLTGIIKGSEEWSGKDRAVVWEWLTPRLPELFGNIRKDTEHCWNVSIEYILQESDPRRYKPLIDFMLDTAFHADFASEGAYDLARKVQLVRSCLKSMQWKFEAWADQFLDLYFKAIACPHSEVRVLMASVMNALDQLKFHPSYPSAAALTTAILEDTACEKDIMHIRSGYLTPYVESFMASLPEWRLERPHGPKASLSTHDTAALTTLTWLALELQDVHSVSAFPYIIPMLPVLFEMRELNDNHDLQNRANGVLVQITSITPSLDLIPTLMEGLISVLQETRSWKTRIHCMPILSLIYFRSLALLSEPCKAKCLDVVAACLNDPNSEVREMASTTLSGFIRCSQRAMVVVLRDRFAREINGITLPKRRDAPGQVNPQYQVKLAELHGAVLGATALVDAFPYTVPNFIPKLLADVLAPRVNEPAPVSTAIRGCVASFKKTHEKYTDKFSEDQLSAMNSAQAGESYYA
ncbi:proteasome activator subunit 4, partial [Tremellales sp. Uapishka_1]